MSQGGAGTAQGGAGMAQGGAGMAGFSQGGAGSGGLGGMGGNAGAGGSTTDDCSALFVSPMGNDSNQGCSLTPFRTIGHALEQAAVLKKSMIRVCAGTFAEQVTVGVDVSIEGSLDCVTWQSTLPEPFDADSDTDTITTLVTNPASSAQSSEQQSTVTLSPGKQATLTGLHVIGHALQDGPSVGIDAADGDAITLERCLVEGGQGQSSAPGGIASLGVNLTGGMDATIRRTRVHGGQGVLHTRGNGSIGLRVSMVASGDAPLPVALDHAVIEGGSGVADGDPVIQAGALGSIGVSSQASLTINDSILRGGEGSVLWGISSMALYVLGEGQLVPVELQMDHSRVDGGLGVTRAGKVPTVSSAQGVYVYGADGAIRDSRIYGGDATSEEGVIEDLPNLGAPASNYGMLLRTHHQFQVINSILVGGNQQNKPHSGYSRALQVESDGQVDLLHDTILGGTAVHEGSNPVGLFLAEQTSLRRFENNLVGVSSVGKNANGAFPIFLQGCEPDRFGTFQGNLLMTALSSAATYESLIVRSPCEGNPPGAVLTTFSQIAAFNPPKTVAGNRFVAATCPQDSSECVAFAPCTSASKCQKAILGADLGPVELAAGWPPLGGELPCDLVQRGALLMEAPTDATGASRTAPTTPGAIEQDSCTK
jgi:hypothetical protein